MDTTMGITHLHDEHEALRAALNALEEVLASRMHTRVALRTSFGVIAAALREHAREEVRQVVACSRRLGRCGSEELARFAIEHHVDQQCVNVIARCLKSEASFSLDAVRPTLTMFICGLRRRMERQEVELFPLLARVVGADPMEQRWEEAAEVRSGVFEPAMAPAPLALEVAMHEVVP